jgi:Cu(I)/Ag(I) efflux system membrane protein CusA/SilA
LPVRAPSPADAAVGFIALAGVAAETGVVMLIYLDQSWQEITARHHAEGQDPSAADLYAAIMEGAVERVGPKMMTVVAIMAGLLPIMWSSGTGSDVMSRIAAPMVGGMVSSTVLTLGVIPKWDALARTSAARGTISCSTVRDVSPLASELTWRLELAARQGGP